MNRPARKTASAPIYLQLRPAGGHKDELWTIRLEKELLALLDPANKTVLTVHREEAARYMRFTYHLFSDRIVTFVIVEGLKSYSFACDKVMVMKLLGWLPQKKPGEIARDVRASGVAVLLFGVLHVLLRTPWAWVAGALLCVIGLWGIISPKRRMHLVNGLAMAGVGLYDLLPRLPAGIDPRAVPADSAFVPVLAGAALLFWGIHQMSLMGLNQQLRNARAIRDKRADFLPAWSAVVQRIMWWTLAGGILFFLYASALFGRALVAGRVERAAGNAGLLESMPVDLPVFAILGLVALASAAAMHFRKTPAYFEAKLSAQLLIAVLVISFWSAVLTFRFSAPLAPVGAIFSRDLSVFARPHLWVTLIVCVVLFNRWYRRTVEAELESQRA